MIVAAPSVLSCRLPFGLLALFFLAIVVAGRPNGPNSEAYNHQGVADFVLAFVRNLGDWQPL